jgi:DNA-binding PadR family transcriptional regulator
VATMRELLRMLARERKKRRDWDDVTIAAALVQRPATSYDLSRGLKLRPGRVYPALRRLLAAGAIADGWGADGRRYYREAGPAEDGDR